MSPLRHGRTAVVAALALGVALSGCSSSDSKEPTASHRTGQHRGEKSSEPTEATSSPTVHPTPPKTPSLLRFSPRSGGKHLDECQRLQPGDDPAEFLYYPVVITPSSSLTLEEVATEHTPGVVDAGAWVAPTGPTPETGTFKGWPPSQIVTGDTNLQWGERVRADNATLAPGTSYNVFLRVQVDPTPGDSEVSGIRFEYLNDDDPAGLSYRVVWAATTTFSMDC